MFTFLQKVNAAHVHNNEDLRLLEIFKPFYYIVSTFGLFPHSVDFLYGKNHLTVVFKSATLTLASNFLVPTVICIFFAVSIVVDIDGASKNKVATGNQMTRTNYIIEVLLEVLACTTIYICAFRNRRLYIEILNEMTGCWTKLPRSAGNKILRQLRKNMYYVVLGTVLLYPILEFPLFFAENNTAWTKISVSLNFFLPELMQFILIAFYLVMIMMVVALLKNIEENIKLFYQAKRSRNSSNNVGELSDVLPASLHQLRGVYARALAIKRQINTAFQTPLMLVLAQSFHALISESHTLYIMTFREKHTLKFVYNSFWVMFQIIKIYTLGHSGAILKLQAAEIGRTLHNIPTDVDENVTLYLEIQHLTTLMKFQSAKITIFGYFSLDSSLIFNVIASATMYLVILVQFDKNK